MTPTDARKLAEEDDWYPEELPRWVQIPILFVLHGLVTIADAIRWAWNNCDNG